jgi:hypothetical protein
VKGIEDQLERVHLFEIGIASRFRGDDQRGIAVVQGDADVDRLVVVEQTDLGAFGAGQSL